MTGTKAQILTPEEQRSVHAATICVTSYCIYICPCTTIYVLIQMEEQRALHAAHEGLKEQLDREHRQIIKKAYRTAS